MFAQHFKYLAGVFFLTSCCTSQSNPQYTCDGTETITQTMVVPPQTGYGYAPPIPFIGPPPLTAKFSVAPTFTFEGQLVETSSFGNNPHYGTELENAGTVAVWKYQSNDHVSQATAVGEIELRLTLDLQSLQLTGSGEGPLTIAGAAYDVSIAVGGTCKKVGGK